MTTVVERVEYSVLPEFGVELLRACYVSHAFARHTHDTMALGQVRQGAGEFYCRSRTHAVTSGSLVMIDAGEVHTGRVARASDRLVYDMIYVPVELAMLARGEGQARWPGFSAPVRATSDGAPLSAAFDAIAQPLTRLEGEQAVLAIIGGMAAFGNAEPARPAPRRHRGVEAARDFLHDHASDAVSLMSLARVAGLAPAYLSRAFHRRYGLPPHAYQVQLRLTRARELMATGLPIAQVAAATGWTDQAHLTRAFKRTYGITPGQYRSAARVRDLRPAT